MAKFKILKNKGQEIFKKFGFKEESMLSNGKDKVCLIVEFSSGKVKSVQYCEIENVEHKEIFEGDKKIKDERLVQTMPSDEFCNNYLQRMADEWAKNNVLLPKLA